MKKEIGFWECLSCAADERKTKIAMSVIAGGVIGSVVLGIPMYLVSGWAALIVWSISGTAICAGLLGLVIEVGVWLSCNDVSLRPNRMMACVRRLLSRARKALLRPFRQSTGKGGTV